MYEFIILALLMQRPAHGYLIAKVIHDAIGPYTKVSSGRLYPLLKQLEDNGLIAEAAAHGSAAASGRRPKQYVITEAGRRRFHDLMLDTSSMPGDYQKLFLLKASVFGLVSAEERLWLIDHYRAYCQAHVLHLTAEIAELAAAQQGSGPIQGATIIEVMRHRLDQWQLELAWIQRLGEQEQSGYTEQRGASDQAGAEEDGEHDIA